MKEVKLMVTDIADFSEKWIIGKNYDDLDTLSKHIEETKMLKARL